MLGKVEPCSLGVVPRSHSLKASTASSPFSSWVSEVHAVCSLIIDSQYSGLGGSEYHRCAPLMTGMTGISGFDLRGRCSHS